MSLQSLLRAAGRSAEKKKRLLEEGFPLEEHFNPKEVSVVNDPFPHVVIDNCFSEKTYEGLVTYFNDVYARGLSQTADSVRFHPFLNLTGKFAYDGYVHSLRLREHPSLAPLFSVAWNMYFSKLFNQPTSFATAAAMHFHPPGDKTGFVHHDLAVKYFSPLDTLPSGVIGNDRPEGDRVPLYREYRVIALLYYLGNDDWKEGDGGGTGIYANPNEAPSLVVEPKNNRLLVFQISPKSFHAFQTNKTNRRSIVQWFHVDDLWVKEKFPDFIATQASSTLPAEQA